jgi:hypothetical protein
MSWRTAGDCRHSRKVGGLKERVVFVASTLAPGGGGKKRESCLSMRGVKAGVAKNNISWKSVSIYKKDELEISLTKTYTNLT